MLHSLEPIVPTSGTAPLFRAVAARLVKLVVAGLVGSWVACDGSGSSPVSPPAPVLAPTAPTNPAPDAEFGVVLFYPRLAAGIETRQIVAGYVSLGEPGFADVTAETMWSTSAPAVVTVDAAGRVRGHAPGRATVSGMHAGRSATQDIEVIAPLARNLDDLPDDLEGPQIHAFYVIPSDGEDRVLDRNGAIASSFQEIQDWTVANLGRQFRFDEHQGELDVTFVRLEETAQAAVAANLVSTIQRNIAGSGATGHKVFAVYYDGRGPSGLRGRARFLTGAVFLDGERPIGSLLGFDEGSRIPLFPFAMEFTMVHELFHTFGAVEACAPHADDGRHVTDDPQDIMSARRALSLPEEGEEEDLTWPTWSVDRDRDDYYEHSNGDCRDIADSGFWEVVRDVNPPTEPSAALTGQRILGWRLLAGRRRPSS